MEFVFIEKIDIREKIAAILENPEKWKVELVGQETNWRYEDESLGDIEICLNNFVEDGIEIDNSTAIGEPDRLTPTNYQPGIDSSLDKHLKEAEAYLKRPFPFAGAFSKWQNWVSDLGDVLEQEAFSFHKKNALEIFRKIIANHYSSPTEVYDALIAIPLNYEEIDMVPEWNQHHGYSFYPDDYDDYSYNLIIEQNAIT